MSVAEAMFSMYTCCNTTFVVCLKYHVFDLNGFRCALSLEMKTFSLPNAMEIEIDPTTTTTESRIVTVFHI